MMKKWVALLVLGAGMIFSSGCQSVKLANGKYTCNLAGREDCAFVYGKHIFLWMKNPVEDSDGGYWFWGGEFEIDDTCRLRMKMDRATAHSWDFYYNFFYQNGAISVADLSREKGFDLRPVSALTGARQEIPPSMDGNSQQPSGVYR